MQIGEYIRDRWMVSMVRAICDTHGISLESYSDDWIHVLSKDDMTTRIIGYRFSLNNSVSSQIAKDKVATAELLQANGINVVPHLLVRRKPSTRDSKTIKSWGGTVIKPLEGTSGLGVKRYDSPNDTLAYIASSDDPWAISPFIDIESELRIVLLDGKLLLAYKKSPRLIDGLKMFNLGLGATADVVTPDDELLSIARRAQSVLGLRLCTVDIISESNGHSRVLEVNDSIMMEHFARQSDEYYELAKQVHETIILEMLN